MGKRRREADSDGSTPTTETATYNTIFIDTSLDTHLAMSVSDSDTITVFKENLVSEHMRCFPEIGEIKIHALKVKRKDYFYHLPDYMHVKSVFKGEKEDWFLYVDVSSLKVHNDLQQTYQKALVCIEHWPLGHDQQNFLPDDPPKTPYAVNEYAEMPNGLEGEVSKDIAMEVGCNADDHCNDFSSGTTEKSALRVQKSDVIYENNGISETTPGLKDDKSRDDDITNVKCFNPAKKHKSRHNAVVACSASKDNNTFVHASDKSASHVETGTTVKSTGNKEDKKTKRKQIKGSVRHHNQDPASVLSSTHVVDVKRSSEQNGLIDSSDLHKLSCAAVGSEDNVQHEVLSEPSEFSQKKLQRGWYQDVGKGSTLPRLSKDVNEPHDLNLDGKIDISEKTAESQKGGASSNKCDKTNVVCHDVNNNANYALHTDNLPDNHEPANHEANKTGEAGDLSPNPDAEVKLSSLKHVPDQGEADMSVENPTLAATFSNVHEAIDDGNGSGSKKKVKKVKKSSKKVLDSINTNQDNNKMNGSSSPAFTIAADISLRDEVKSHQGFIPLTQTDQTKQEEGERESGFTMKLSDANVAKELKTSGSKKKKTARKSARAVREDATDMEHADNCVSHSTTAPNLHTAEKIEEDKSYLSCAESKETSKRKSSDASARNAGKKDGKLSGDVETLRPITQTAETEEKGENMIGRMGKDNIQDVPTKEQGNGTECAHQDEANRAVENAENTNKIVKKKKKKSRSSVENYQESAPINDKKIDEGITSLDDKVEEVDTPSKEQGNKIARKQLNQTNKSCENTEKGETKSRKKTKDDQNPAAYGDSYMPIEDRAGDVVASNDRLRELDTSSKVPERLVHMSLVLDQSNKTQEHSGNTTKKAKKAKGNRSSAVDSHSNFPIKNQGVIEDITASTHELRELDSHSKTTQKLRRRHLNQTSASESKKNAVENNFEGTATEISTGNLAEVARCEEEVNFKQYFVPEQHQSGVVTKLSAETIAEKRVEESGLPSVGTAPELQQGGSIITLAGKAKDTTKSSKVTKTKKKTEKHGLAHAPTSLEFDEIEAPQKPVATAISNGSDTNKSVPAKEKDKSLNGASLTSSSESSERTHLKKKDEKFRTPLKKKDEKESGLRRHDVTSKRVSTKLHGEFTNSGKQEKSLLSTPRSIFQDESGESSRDENGLVDSDASTRTPSDNSSSSSSGYSTDESEISKNPSKNGPNGVKRKGGNRENSSKLEYSVPKQIPMDMIFRSSSRFKKAKLTASQQLDDSEIQPVDFVPDSQAPE